MPQHYTDGKIFRVKGSGEFYEATFKVNREEAMILSLVNQQGISREFRDEIQAFFNRMKELPKDEEVMESRIESVLPVVHDEETSQQAIPNSKRWTQNLHDAYNLLRGFPDGLTDQESQDRYATMRGLDRRDIGDSWRPARHALAGIGLVRKTGEKRRVRSGREAIVWAVVDNTWTPPNIDAKINNEQLKELIEKAKKND